MRSSLLAVAVGAAAIVAATAAFAADAIRPAYTSYQPMNDYSATLSMWGGGSTPTSDLGAFTQNPAFLGGSGSVNLNMMGYGVQLDAIGEGGIIDGGDYGYATGVIGAHLYLRDPGHGLIGVLGNLASYGDGYNEYGYFRFALGAEGQLYQGPLTLYGQVAYLGKTVDTCDCATTSTFAKLEGRWFASPNLMLAVRGEWDGGNIWSSDTFSRSTLGLRGEVKLGDSPLSVFADAAFSSHRYDGAHSFNDTTFKAGATVHVGKRTLLDEDRTGSSLTQPYVGVDELMHYYY